MAYTSEEIAKFFPRVWNGNFSIVYGINDIGEATPLKVGDDGTLVTSGGGGGVTTVMATNLNFWATPTGTGSDFSVVITGISDDDGWIDVRAFSRFSLTAACMGTYNATSLSFNGTVKVEYRNFLDEPSQGTLITSPMINSSRDEIIDPKVPEDILGISYIRIVINGTGTVALFGIAK